jgi:hypothetical protein
MKMVRLKSMKYLSLESFFIESVVGMSSNDGSSSPTSKKEETLLDKNMANMSR